MSTQFALDLRLARRKAGYTQGDVAHLLSGHQSLVSDLEQGRRRPNLEQIIELSLIYGRSFESFFAELLTERQTTLQVRLGRLPEIRKPTAHTFNRANSLSRLKKRLASQIEHGRA
ncbi:helix-turn-helix transcriptional regulator [Jannaschia sp. KMU-145]|uniref:helix-turn-helix transcriptional regulator n=1 Tax=Jannaschia halovivens TaxID=3388667 RepID=UPI00396B431B